MRHRRTSCLAFIVFALAASSSSVARAEDVWVKRAVLDVLEGKAAAYPVVTKAKKGDKLTVLAHEGNWLKVQAGGREGYVFEDSVSTRKIQGDGGGLAHALGSAEASQMASGASGKGLLD